MESIREIKNESVLGKIRKFLMEGAQFSYHAVQPVLQCSVALHHVLTVQKAL